MKRLLWRGASVSLLSRLTVMVALLLSPFMVQTALADNARIQGTVTDPSGAAVEGVKLIATNIGTNIPYEATSEAGGNYVFANLPVGAYKVDATKTGFRAFSTSDITLSVDQIYTLNIKLELGQVSETVRVEVSNVQVQTTNTQLGTVISGDTIVAMPLNGRNWVQLQQLQPGVMAGSDRFGTGTGGTAFSTNGSQTQQNSFLINGQDSNDLPLNTALIIPSPDAIAEFNLVTNTINPEYGRNSGAIMNAVIKSGTNSFHGDAFDFYRDTFLNTSDFFTHAPAVFHQNQFGGTIGGPVIKNKTFFFFSYQGTRARQPQASTTSTVFSPAERGGNFSADGIQTSSGTSPFPLFGNSASTCPVSSGVKCAAGTAYSALFGGPAGTPDLGVIPAEDLNSIAVNLMKTFVPLPTNTITNGFSFNAVTQAKTDQYLWQVDHTFSSKDSIRSYGFVQTSPSQDTLPFTGSTLPGFPELAQRHLKQYTASWNHIFSPSVLNELRFGYTRFNFVAVQPVTPVLPSSLGFDINPQSPGGAGVPKITLTGTQSFILGFSNNGPQPRIDQTYQLDDNFTYVLGKHSLKFGFDGRRFHVTNPFFFDNNGAFSFNQAGTFTTGVSGADFLLGIPDSYTQSSGGFIDAGAQMFYFYTQDSWKATSNFTVNYGLAYQVNTPTTDHFNHDRAINCFRPGQQSTVYPTAPVGLVFPGDNGCTPSGYETGFNHIMPRLGVAWAPSASGFLHHLTGDAGKFSIRAGGGVYFNQSEEELTLQNLTAPPFSLQDSGIGDIGGNPSFAAPFTDIQTGESIPNKYPFTPPPAGSAVDFTFFEPMSLNLLDPKFAVPYSVNYNLTVQRELPAQMILSVGYVGSQGRHEERAFELNPAINPSGCVSQTIVLNGSTFTCAQLRTNQGLYFPQNFRYPGIIPGSVSSQFPNGILIFGSAGQQATDGNSVYHSLQASLNKRVSHGLDFLVSYTYSHARDNGSSLENSAFGVRGTNPLIPSFNWGDSAFDGRQRLVLSYTYRVPTLRQFSSGALSRVFKGWMVAGNTTFQTGFPINVGDSGFRSLTCWAFSFYGCPDNPNQVAPIVISNPRSSKSNLYFNPSAFARQALGSFGNSGRDSFHGPGINVTNLALMKDTYINETMYFEVRLETFNTFNHVNFNAPTSNIASGNFGRVLSDSNIGPRLVQLAAKFYF